MKPFQNFTFITDLLKYISVTDKTFLFSNHFFLYMLQMVFTKLK